MRPFCHLTGLALLLLGLPPFAGQLASSSILEHIDRPSDAVDWRGEASWVGPATEKGGVIEPDG